MARSRAGYVLGTFLGVNLLFEGVAWVGYGAGGSRASGVAASILGREAKARSRPSAGLAFDTPRPARHYRRKAHPRPDTRPPMRPDRYNFAESRAKWQKIWEERQVFKAGANPSAPKYYVLEMFPYPSGRIHMGHVRNYSMGDVIARYMRARGYQRAASDGLGRFRHAGRECRHADKAHPATWTYANIATMRAQLKSHGPVARLVARDRDLRSRPITSISRSCFSISCRPASSIARNPR